MTRPLKIVLALVVVALLGVGGFFLFEYIDDRGKIHDAGRGCANLDNENTALPPSVPGFSLPADEKFLSSSTQGKTTILEVSAAGKRPDLVKVRDAVLASLASQGFRKTGTDQEPTYEAEGSFKGAFTGTIKVKPLCQDRISIRYTFNQ